MYYQVFIHYLHYIAYISHTVAAVFLFILFFFVQLSLITFLCVLLNWLKPITRWCKYKAARYKKMKKYVHISIVQTRSDLLKSLLSERRLRQHKVYFLNVFVSFRLLKYLEDFDKLTRRKRHLLHKTVRHIKKKLKYHPKNYEKFEQGSLPYAS